MYRYNESALGCPKCILISRPSACACPCTCIHTRLYTCPLRMSRHAFAKLPDGKLHHRRRHLSVFRCFSWAVIVGPGLLAPWRRHQSRPPLCRRRRCRRRRRRCHRCCRRRHCCHRGLLPPPPPPREPFGPKPARPHICAAQRQVYPESRYGFALLYFTGSSNRHICHGQVYMHV